MKSSLNATLTVRLPKTAVRRVRARARSLGVTPSDLVRVALEREVGALHDALGPFELTRRWIGALKGSAVDGRQTRAEIEDWNPDRRG